MTKPDTHKEVEEVFQNVMEDIGRYYNVSDRLSDILIDSLSKHLPNALISTQSQVLDRAIDNLRECRKQASPSWHKGLDTAIQRLKQIKTDDE